MIKKRLFIANLFFVMLILFGTQAQAVGFGWQATVRYSNFSFVHIRAPSHGACVQQRTYAINTPPAGLTPTSATPCVAIPFRFEKPINIKDLNELFDPKKWPWPWPPVCLSCPNLNDITLKLVYPDHYKQVQWLMDKYNVGTYNEQLLKLQQSFDLEGFEAEMFDLEMNMEGNN